MVNNKENKIDMENTYNCKQCGKGLLIGQVCTCFLKNAGIERVDMDKHDKSELRIAHEKLIETVKSLSEENKKQKHEIERLKFVYRTDRHTHEGIIKALKEERDKYKKFKDDQDFQRKHSVKSK